MARIASVAREPMVEFVRRADTVNMLLPTTSMDWNKEQFGMMTPKDVNSRPEADLSATTGSLPLGRIVHDDRGNAVWKWRGENSSTEETTSGVLKHIDPVDLSVEGQGSAPVRPGATRVRAPDAGGGYDPYNQDQARLPSKPLPKKGGRDKS
jgi:hypothetical protein